MNPRQKRFVEEYIQDFNATQAVIRAGYSKNGARVTGCRLLANPNITVEIRKMQSKRAEKLEVTEQMVIDGLLAEATREGEGSTASARVQAWAQIGKWRNLAMFKDVHESNTNLTVKPGALSATMGLLGEAAGAGSPQPHAEPGPAGPVSADTVDPESTRH